jgi:hypothetical protein
LAVGLVLVVAATALPSLSKVYVSRDAALLKAFGEGADVERQTRFLTEAQVERAKTLAGSGVEIRSAMVTRYVGRRDGKVVGTAYFDTHRVRTLQETLMVLVGPTGEILALELLSFDEPEDYRPRDAWYEQFTGRSLDSELALKRGIHGITGATLSAESATDAVRRTLAIVAVLQEEEGA